MMAKTKFGTIEPSGKTITALEIDLRKIKSSDPLAYAYGLFQGKIGKSLPKKRGLAPEFVRGWKEGHEIFKRKKDILKKVI
jgi:hypothetical protein